MGDVMYCWDECRDFPWIIISECEELSW